MKRIHGKVAGLTLVSVAIITHTPANAADLYRQQPSYTPPAPVYTPPPNTWTGFYIGANGGYAWNGGGDNATFDGGQISRPQPQGGFGGGQIGYNLQHGHLVFGFETDFQGGDISDSVSSTTAGFDARSQERVDWFGTARGRLGYAFDRTLFYFTGGFAYGNVNQSASVTSGADGFSLKKDDVQTGFVLGGGLEYKITPGWSLKGEYQYIDLGSERLSGLDATGAPVETNHLDTNFHTVRVGVNYHFNSAYEPLK